MIKEIRVENYKSIQELQLNLGRATILIGENGSGKSNILEAIALSSAAANHKLDNEFLAAIPGLGIFKGNHLDFNPKIGW